MESEAVDLQQVVTDVVPSAIKDGVEVIDVKALSKPDKKLSTKIGGIPLTQREKERL